MTSVKGLHMGSQSGYERFVGSYFEKRSETGIDKVIMHLIQYSPDKTYINTDGYGGTCWMVDLKRDTGMSSESFRNLEDLIEQYEANGYKLVDLTKC